MTLRSRHAMIALAATLLVGVALLGSALGDAAGSALRSSELPGAHQARVRTFSGTGNKRLGTLRLRRATVLSWKAGGGPFQISDRRGFRILYTRASKGHLTIRRGAYRGLRASAQGKWRIVLRPKRRH
jgi:hypothetical protein